MKMTLTSYFLIAALALGLVGVTARWTKYKLNPTETVREETFEIDRSMVKNAQSNKTYFGTVKVTERREALTWPKVDVVITRDTLSVEEGGYFGVPN